jgi:lysozyme family protein
MTLDTILNELIEREGGYTNNPADRGGPTRYGITEKTARRHGYGGPMENLPLDKAKEIYTDEYWTLPNFVTVARFSEDVAVRLFDFGVNAGPGTSAEMLQTALNALGAKLAVDGQIGDGTVAALKKYYSNVKRRNDDLTAVLVGLVRAQQAIHYCKLVEANQSQEEFLFGWLKRLLV